MLDTLLSSAAHSERTSRLTGARLNVATTSCFWTGGMSVGHADGHHREDNRRSGTLPECSNEFIRKNASSFEHSGANIYLNVRTKSGPVQSVWHPGAIYTPSPPNIERMSFRCIGKPTSHSWQS